MSSELNRFRAVLAALALLSICVFAASTLIPTHWHSSAAPDNCAICQAGHLVFIEVAERPAAWPPELISTDIHAAVTSVPAAGDHYVSPPRGPPNA
jgi:hypothetical protein